MTEMTDGGNPYRPLPVEGLGAGDQEDLPDIYAQAAADEDPALPDLSADQKEPRAEDINAEDPDARSDNDSSDHDEIDPDPDGQWRSQFASRLAALVEGQSHPQVLRRTGDHGVTLRTSADDALEAARARHEAEPADAGLADTSFAEPEQVAAERAPAPAPAEGPATEAFPRIRSEPVPPAEALPEPVLHPTVAADPHATVDGRHDTSEVIGATDESDPHDGVTAGADATIGLQEAAESGHTAGPVEEGEAPSEERPDNARHVEDVHTPPQVGSAAEVPEAKAADDGGDGRTPPKQVAAAGNGEGDPDNMINLEDCLDVLDEPDGWLGAFATLAVVRPRFGQEPNGEYGAVYTAADPHASAVMYRLQPHTIGDTTTLPKYFMGGGYVRGLIGSLVPQLDVDRGAATVTKDEEGNILIVLNQPVTEVVPNGGIQIFADTTDRRAARKLGREVVKGFQESLGDSAYDSPMKERLVDAIHTDHFYGLGEGPSSLATPNIWLAEVPDASGEGTQRAISIGHVYVLPPDSIWRNCVLQDMEGNQVAITHPTFEAMVGRLLSYTVLNRDERENVQEQVDDYIEAMVKLDLENEVRMGEQWAADLIQSVHDAYSWRLGEVIDNLVVGRVGDLIPRFLGKSNRMAKLAAHNPRAPLEAIGNARRRVGAALQHREPNES